MKTEIILLALVIGLTCGGHAANPGSGKASDKPAAALLELTNERLAVQFSATHGSVTSIRNHAPAVNYTTSTPAPGLFRLKYLINGTQKQVRELHPDSGTLIGHTQTRQADVQTSDPLMGTESELAAVIKKVRQQGAHVAFYINGQAWDPRWPRVPPECAGKIPPTIPIPNWEAGFKESALLHYDGTFYSQYRKASGHWPDPAPDSPYNCLFYFMCPASKGWQDHLHYWTVERYVKLYGTDAMFLDQIGAETAKYCFNPAHEHTDHGVWTQGFAALAKRIKKDARRLDPGFALETEGFGDAYAADFDSFFIAPSSTGVWGDSHPEIARYTFPENIFFDGFWRIQNPDSLRTPAETLNEVFLIGNRFLIYAQPDNLTRHTMQVVNLRRRIKHVLYSARFMDELGTAVSDARVRVKRFVLNQGNQRVTLLNILNKDRVPGVKVTVDLGRLGPVREAAIATLGSDVRAVMPEASGQQASFSVPPEVLSSFILVHSGTGVIEQACRAEQLPLVP